MDRNLHWRTQQFVERLVGTSVEAVRIVEQLTTDMGEYFVLAVRTPRDRYWVVAETSELALYPREAYLAADDALQAHMAVTNVG